jgi:hypothetical protein
VSGYKTIIFSVLTTLLGILQSQGITDIVATHPGAIMTAVGLITGILRVVTTSAIFK